MEGIFKHLAVIVVLLTLVGIPVLAQEEDGYTYSRVTFLLKDANTDETLSSVPIQVNLFNLDSETDVVFIERLNSTGAFVHKMSPGPWLASVSVDTSLTPEIDYFGELVFSVGRTETESQHDVYLIPVGSIEGTVEDDVGNLVADADLQFICKSSLKVNYPQNSDRSGFFSKEIVPVGLCKITAVYANKVGRAEVAINQGELSSVSITLEKSLGRIPNLWMFFLTAGLVFAGVAYYLLRVRKPKGNVAQVSNIEVDSLDVSEDDAVVNIVQNGDQALNLRAKDIIKTLSDRERAVVDFLIENNHKGTQAQIRNSKGIPKTSLARILQSLEGKNVLRVETIGKLKKVELTDWFLGKE